MARRRVVIGFVGTRLDAGKGRRRWGRWRPSVDLCRQEELPVDRVELLYEREASAELVEVLRADIGEVSPATEVRGHLVPVQDPWDFEEVYGALFDWVRAYAFRPGAEDYLVHMTTGTHVAQICWFLLAESRHLPARLLQTIPPRPRRSSEVGSTSVIDLDLSRYDRIAGRFARAQESDQSFLKAGIETRNAGFNRLIERIEQVAGSSPAPLLLTGPTGAGKSQLARRIYELKRRRNLVAGPLVEVNCATLRGDAAMSALFGHVKGAFTGAARERQGLLRAADQGVLFLDEIGELGLDEQAMLLRAIEEKTFLPLGSDREVRSEFQLLAGTKRALRAEVAAGRFREDLLARIDLWTFRLPALRERPEDLEPNLDFELERVGQALGTRLRLTREARRRFLEFATGPEGLWLGNFRDLNAAITRLATLSPAGRIGLGEVREELERLRASWQGQRREPGRADLLPALLGPALAELDLPERAALAEIVRVCRRSPSLSAAGRELYAASRQRKTSRNDADRLRKVLAKYGLSFGELRAEG